MSGIRTKDQVSGMYTQEIQAQVQPKKKDQEEGPVENIECEFGLQPQKPDSTQDIYLFPCPWTLDS